MGQDQSRDSTKDVSTWSPKELDAYIFLRKRLDGSSVKELYVPEWRVAFYRGAAGIELIDNCDCASGSGNVVKIDVDSASALYKAWVNYRLAKEAFALTGAVFTKYVDGLFKV
jgi:hypothetical protein